jgi:uncharacterized protein YciI
VRHSATPTGPASTPSETRAERDAGNLRVAGAFDPPTGGALVFRGVEREHVEEFARTDPYLEAGLITAWRVQRWLLV